MIDKDPEIVRIIKKGDYENSPTTTTVKSKMGIVKTPNKRMRKNSYRRYGGKLYRIMRRNMLEEQNKDIETHEVS